MLRLLALSQLRAPMEDRGRTVTIDLSTRSVLDWGSYEGRARLPCPEDPVLLRGQPIGMYHCPYCGMMCVACVPHPSPDESDAEPGDEGCVTTTPYEEIYGRPWPPGYRVSRMAMELRLIEPCFEVVEDNDGTFTRAILRIRHPPDADKTRVWSKPTEVMGPYRRSPEAAMRALLLDLSTKDDFVRLLLRGR